MKVYISAPYELRDEAIQTMYSLEEQGHRVTSRWLKTPEHEILRNPGIAQQANLAVEDLDDVVDADALVAYNPAGWENKGTGGRHVELGYAIAMGKRIVLYGVRSNFFHSLGVVDYVQTFEELVEVLK